VEQQRLGWLSRIRFSDDPLGRNDQ
jgi:hypothetical protein